MRSSESSTVMLPEEEKERLKSILVQNLPVLRAKIGLSQEDVSNIIGVTRQTYSALENMKRPMPWSTFLSLILVFGCNESTGGMLDNMGVLTQQLNCFLSQNKRKGMM